MNNAMKAIAIGFLVVVGVGLVYYFGFSTKKNSAPVEKSIVAHEETGPKKFKVELILGSTRQGRTSEKLGKAFKQMLDKRSDINAELVDLLKYNLPFFDEAVPPASREKITNPIIQTWSDEITGADAFIFVIPEYNSGYPGVLKNAVDSLYKEWNGKPAALVGYSGGPGGGASALAQFKEVARAVQLMLVSTEIRIPSIWKAFDEQGKLVNIEIEKQLNAIVDELKAAAKK